MLSEKADTCYWVSPHQGTSNDTLCEGGRLATFADDEHFQLIRNDLEEL